MNSVFFPIFEIMPSVNPKIRSIETLSFPSEILERTVPMDLYIPPEKFAGEDQINVLLFNDGQDLLSMAFDSIVSKLYDSDFIKPLLCIGIHAGPMRKIEYGTAVSADYKGRGNLAGRYMHFITRELIPSIHLLFPGRLKSRWGFAGFSLGGLSALDISWKQGELFNLTGIFSGSLWWRTLDKSNPEYSDERHRIMHNQIRDDIAVPGLRFFLECGTADETEDRNGNGVIDSIDDTKDLIRALINKGYDPQMDIYYHEIDGGKHDIPTWALAMPVFLKWGYGINVISI